MLFLIEEYRDQFSRSPGEYTIDENTKIYKESKKGIYVLIAIVFLIIFLGSIFVFRERPSEKSQRPATTTTISLAQACGNRVCERNENCYDCPADCPCEEDKYCDDKTKTCVAKGICGDGKCSLYESKESCCVDCGCWYATQICNRSKMSCEWIPMKLSNDEAIRFVRSHLEKENLKIKDIRVVGEYGDEEKIYKTVVVEIEGEEWPRYFRVDEEGNVEEFYPT